MESLLPSSHNRPRTASLLENGLLRLEKCSDYTSCHCGLMSTHSTTPLGDEDDRGDEIPPLVTRDRGIRLHLLADP